MVSLITPIYTSKPQSNIWILCATWRPCFYTPLQGLLLQHFHVSLCRRLTWVLGSNLAFDTSLTHSLNNDLLGPCICCAHRWAEWRLVLVGFPRGVSGSLPELGAWQVLVDFAWAQLPPWTPNFLDRCGSCLLFLPLGTEKMTIS